MLIDRGIPPYIIRVLLGFYLNNMIRVAWNGILRLLLAVNGVKQGGVLSPVIFSVYIDGLLVRLENARVGCHIGSYYVGALAYADDILLLAPTPTAMRQMLNICDEYAHDHSIVFNGSKSKCLISEPRKRIQLVRALHRDMRQFAIGGKEIEFVDTFVRLGHVIRSDMNDNGDVENQRCKFIGQTNNELCCFGKLL